MTGKRSVEWPPHVRDALLIDVRLTHEAAQEAEARLKMRIYLAVEQGLTTRQIAEQLGSVSQQTISRWRLEGEALCRERLTDE
ncbi:MULTISPECIES: helix-turn-helix domain-containing protein [Actinomycetes]|uniref:helix-turn-helix domain-containing protein n=1 Tax=Actinomycetes TaxID=1760 RepID=UPI0033CBC2A7